MAKSKKTHRGKRGSRTSARRPAVEVEPAPTGTVRMHSIFGEIEVPASLAGIMDPKTPSPSDDDFTLLDLTDCEVEIDFMSPGFVTRALAEAEGLDPEVADRLVSSFSMLMPAVTLRGERSRLMAAAPVLRLIRRVELFPGDTHEALMGFVYGLPRIVLAEFENGPAAQAARDELARAFDAWDGRLLLVLDTKDGGRGMRYEVGYLFAVHHVELKRPVLSHGGEGAVP